MNEPSDAISLKSFQDCRARLGDDVIRTPVLLARSEAFDATRAQGTEIWLKLELFQRSGTFKARGALNCIKQLCPHELEKGVTAFSAGNHAIATAFAAKTCGTTAKVVMSNAANRARVARALEYGAEILFAADGRQGFALVEEICRQEGRTLLHPFEGPCVAQGAGTVGLELAEQIPELDAVVIAIGGGGLCGGSAAAIRQLQSRCAVYGVEPEGADSMRRSIAAGKPVTLPSINTIADSLAPPMTLPYSFDLCRRFVEEVVTVSDQQMRQTMKRLFDDLKLAVEPAGAAATAAVFGPLRERLAHKKVGVVICGSNIDSTSFIEHIRAA
jgi:threonine dehydratase